MGGMKQDPLPLLRSFFRETPITPAVRKPEHVEQAIAAHGGWLAFDDYLHYIPSWQEVATFTGVLAYGVILYSLSYRYLPLFGQSKGADKNVSVD